MSTNDDFSFIRFLKVVKTLYEASSFTQLGKTVRTALRKPGDPTIEEEDSIIDESDTPTKSMSMEQEEVLSEPPSEQSAILKALAACTSPKSMPECNIVDGKSSSRQSNGNKQILDSTPGDAQNSSLLEQVMTCTLGHLDEDFSDEDTYHGRSIADDDTYGTDTLGEATTYDSLTDEGYESNRRPRRARGGRRIR